VTVPADRPEAIDRFATRQVEPLVLLPGTLCDRRVFEPLMERLPPRNFLVPTLDGAETAMDMAVKLLRELPPGFALAGFSLGGIVALEMVALAPGRVTRLALIDTTPCPDPPSNWVARRNAVDRAAAIGLDRYVTDRLWPLYVSDANRVDERIRALISSMSSDAGVETFRRQSEIAIHRADSRPRLSAISVPTLVLCGEGDRLCSAAIHREMADLIPGSELAIVPEAGHFALIENPDAVALEILAWLARTPFAGSPS